ncbi:2460_t:CDS:2 [Entrophospora sp. SA101]|nr:1373_t:CDS:2 [Entrophospora sp. SA101]CAJ0626826.1 2460_t:CDS:2 [Entrophospora sp. SA101]CAJ0884436.1 2250_t:CDS:2 [Entrophospora sp. SA101]CAJ0906981.1 13723_t:CDS:2 [Entrophospora sp. SA101]CAJ0914530.1 7614_t:CDS:2 [Entrophospora sp. SA101]
MFEKIPIEVLAEIFSETTPKDLYCLTLVCKRVRIILWSSSELAQSIWRRSRLKHITHSTLQPPKDMTEQEYIWLMVVAKKCQFCNETDKFKLSLYWEFRIYCCRKCLNQRVVSGKELQMEWKLSKSLLKCLQSHQKSYDTNTWQPNIFLIAHVNNLIKEYTRLSATATITNSDAERKNWIKNKQMEIRRLQIENIKYKELFDECRYSYIERAQRKLAILYHNRKVNG